MGRIREINVGSISGWATYWLYRMTALRPSMGPKKTRYHQSQLKSHSRSEDIVNERSCVVRSGSSGMRIASIPPRAVMMVASQ